MRESGLTGGTGPDALPNVAITPRVFCRLATVMWMEDPVTKTTMEEWNMPWEVLHIPYPVLEALAEQNWVPWHVVYQFEIEQCWLFGTISVFDPIPLP